MILVISEFGRMVHENGNGGTDHGHGNVMWIMGGPVKGKKVYGNWPGLSTANLYQERDLAITTDFPRTDRNGAALAHAIFGCADRGGLPGKSARNRPRRWIDQGVKLRGFCDPVCDRTVWSRIIAGMEYDLIVLNGTVVDSWGAERFSLMSQLRTAKSPR